jgi:hypothetical protein
VAITAMFSLMVIVSGSPLNDAVDHHVAAGAERIPRHHHSTAYRYPWACVSKDRVLFLQLPAKPGVQSRSPWFIMAFSTEMTENPFLPAIPVMTSGFPLLHGPKRMKVPGAPGSWCYGCWWGCPPCAPEKRNPHEARWQPI